MTFELGISKNLKIEYYCRYVRKKYHNQKNSHKKVNSKQSILHDCFTVVSVL